MFRCSSCKKTAPPRVKPVIIPNTVRNQQYNHYDVEDNPVVKFGTETVSESYLCPSCAGTPVHVEPITDMRAEIGLGLAMQGHARKCNKKLDECGTCQRAVKIVYPSIPAPAIARVLTEVQIHAGRLSICELTVHSMTERTKHKSKRATADFLAAFPVLKGYEQRGGRL